MKAALRLFAITTFLIIPTLANAGTNILGKWISEQRNLVVEVYQTGKEFKARIVWAAGTDPERRVDEKNPDPGLRARKIIGMDVVRGLIYNEGAQSFENGSIYDATTGKTYSATAAFDGTETLVVRGFWGCKLLGKTLKFKRWK